MKRLLQVSLSIVTLLSLAAAVTAGDSIAAGPGQPEYTYISVQFPDHNDGFVLASRYGKPY